VGETGVFKQLFATMNDVLDEIIRQYPAAQGAKKKELEEQVHVLKNMSDSCIEQWLNFEEKMEQWTEHSSGTDIAGPIIKQPSITEPSASAPLPMSNAFVRGQGYYQLFMYDQAIQEFEAAVEAQPDFLLARLYLALGHMRKGDYVEAYRQFQLLISLTENKKVKAISFNAMGCIQAKNRNVEKAQEYFQMAYKADPSFLEPLMNMSLTLQEEEKLLFESGLMK
jgi:tetratricopeptide (TPR) repeat protein